ncbi:MAG: right-handed parallel beta-helix repeat-containing protein [Lewinellaceae bacterium]|nr:right-handed parallel beta-helix repeat-containing protein [Lewinellaceae bacterium]
MRLLFLMLLLPVGLQAQFVIPEPVVGTGIYAFSDTVYMSPVGDDGNPGTVDAPVQSFAVALQKIPFGTAGVNNGENYGLIRLLPGTYVTSTGFQQNENQWKQGSTYKNVSVEGIGQVIIQGALSAPASNHALRLVGNHFFVKNLALRRTLGIGLLINRSVDNPDAPGPSHVLVENVTTDSTGSHGFLIQNTDYVLVRNCHVLNTSRINFSELPQSACTAWPSGLKFHFSRFIRVENSEVAYTRGEGLNFHNCQYVEAVGNRLHDNPTNLYNDNSAKLIIHRNYLYQTPGASEFGLVCPQQIGTPLLAGMGILMGNEGSCLTANYGPVFQFCSAVQCSILGFGAYSFPTIDSVFIYNNIIQNCGRAIAFWEGSVNINNPNCIKNVFVVHNTCIGLTGDSLDNNGAQIHLFFPSYNFIQNSYGQLLNVRFYGNIFSFDQADYPTYKSLQTAFNVIGVFDYSFDYNLWCKQPANPGPNDLLRPDLPGSFNIDSLQRITPCLDDQGVLVQAVPAFADWINRDYYGTLRPLFMHNVGALEPDCSTAVGQLPDRTPTLTLFPNPGTTHLTVTATSGALLRLLDARGLICAEIIANGTAQSLPVANLPAGVYWLTLQHEDGTQCTAWVKMP